MLVLLRPKPFMSLPSSLEEAPHLLALSREVFSSALLFLRSPGHYFSTKLRKELTNFF